MIGTKKSSCILLLFLVLTSFKAQSSDPDEGGRRASKRSLYQRGHQRRPARVLAEDYVDYEQIRHFLEDEGDAWPKFEDIERLAGVPEWKRERWKGLPSSTQRPEGARRTPRFTYRRVQGGYKENAIIAVVAPGPDGG